MLVLGQNIPNVPHFGHNKNFPENPKEALLPINPCLSISKKIHKYFFCTKMPQLPYFRHYKNFPPKKAFHFHVLIQP